MPINSSMIPLTQTLFPLRMMLYRVVNSRCRIRPQHTKKVKNYSNSCPVIISLEAPHQKYDTKNNSQQDSSPMRCRIPYFLFLGVSNHAFSLPFERCKVKTFFENNTEFSKKLAKHLEVSHYFHIFATVYYRYFELLTNNF